METEVNQRPRNRWTPSLDKVLADLVVKQIQLGNRHDNNIFERKSWINIRNEFNQLTELNYNINQLRKHLEVLRQRYDKLRSSRVENNEYVLEDTESMLGFDLWEDFGVQPRSNKPVKVKECPIYEQLFTIFGDDPTEGTYAQSSHFKGLEESVANPTTSPVEETVRSENLSAPNVAEASTNVVVRKRKRKRGPDSSSTQINPAALETIAGALSDMVAAFKSRMPDSETVDERFSITNCIKSLDEIENVDEGLYFAALDLFENPGLRETFMSLNGNRLRLTWLQGKCRNLFSSFTQLG